MCFIIIVDILNTRLTIECIQHNYAYKHFHFIVATPTHSAAHAVMRCPSVRLLYSLTRDQRRGTLFLRTFRT